MLKRNVRGMKNPGVFLEPKEKIFFIIIGETLPSLQLDVRVVIVIEVGNLNGNQEGQN
jgi:hypothetical protein